MDFAPAARQKQIRDAIPRVCADFDDRYRLERDIDAVCPHVRNWAEPEAANLTTMKAAWLHDTGQECGAEANAAKYTQAPSEPGYRLDFAPAATPTLGEVYPDSSGVRVYLAAEAGFRATEQAAMTHGGMGYAREYQVERLFRESPIPRIAPVSREPILSYLAERMPGQPQPY